MFRGLEVVTIAVPDIEAAVAQWRVVLDMEPSTRGDLGLMQTAFFDMADSSIELVQDDDPASPVGRFMKRTEGKGGVYYLGLKTESPRREVDELRERGVEILGDPGPGVEITNEAFVHPASASGVLIRLLPLGYRPR